MLQQEFVSARRHGRELSVIFADIDHSKRFNDSWGHQVGDLVLQEVAARVRACCRDADIVARYGGEEIAVVLREASSDAARRSPNESVKRSSGHRWCTRGPPLHVMLSLGVADLKSSTPDRETLLREADSALYLSKHKGRNRVTAI
jgi:diguanylate cyclase (GGDEF)-like protein